MTDESHIWHLNFATGEVRQITVAECRKKAKEQMARCTYSANGSVELPRDDENKRD